MKKSSVAWIGVVMVILLFCTSCGSTQMPDDVLKTAIRAQNSDYDAYGLNITDFSVNDRQYDKQYKTENVAVDVTAENGESIYQVAYDIMGRYEDKAWHVTSVQVRNSTTMPKKALPDDMLLSDAEALLQDKENIRCNLTAIGSYGNSGDGLQQDVQMDVALCSETPYLNATRWYSLHYQYSLDGWRLVSTDAQDVIFTIIADDLCGTWTASNGEDSYTFVIDHIEDGVAYVKYQAQILMPLYSWSSTVISRGYDALTPVPISVVYHDWESPYCGLEIIFETSKYSQYWANSDESLQDPLPIGMRVYPQQASRITYANGTVEKGDACVTTDVGQSTMHGEYILTRQ